jgi:putative salt-induced outer membrane protein YdiY
MPLRALSSLICVLLLATAALAQTGSQGVYLNAPGPRIFRLPPVDEQPVEGQPADDAAAPSRSPAVEQIPAPPAPAPKAEPSTSETGGAKDDEPPSPLDRLADSRFVPEPLRDYWRQWDASIEFGLQGTEGNTTTFNMRAGGKAERKTDLHLHTLEFTHIDNSKENKQTALSTLIDGRYERQFGATKWNYFAHTLTEFDEFKAFDVRISADTGLGYQWLKTDAARLMTRLGASASREIGGPSDAYTPELSSGVEWKHKLSDRQNVFAKVDYFPDVTNWQDFRLNSKAEWEMVVSKTWGLSLKMSVIDRYDSTPDGARPNDLNYSALVLWSL